MTILALLAPSSKADIVLFGLDTTTNGEVPNRVDPSKPFLTLRFEDTAVDQVTMTFDATNLLSSNFITDVYFNFDGNPLGGAVDPLVFPGYGGSFQSSNPPSIIGGFVSFNAEAGLFNLRFAFNFGGSDVFAGGETTTAVLGGIGLRASDIIAASIDKPAPNPSIGGWFAAAQVRGIQLAGGREGAGFVGTKPYTVVPEPSSIILFALGGLGLAAFRSRRHGR
jgi:hypothetical protein